MSFLLFPDLMFDTYTELTPAYLKEKGVTLLLSDLDNTLALHETARPTDAVRAWVRELTEGGVQLMIVSNNRKPDRVRAYCHDLGIPYVGHAGKPKPGGFQRAMERMGRTPAQTAIVGDQIFTDILGGRNAGVLTLLVEPIRLAGNPGRYLRYAAEWPFRILGKRRSKPL